MTIHNPLPPPPLPPTILGDPPSAQASFGDGNNSRPRRERRFMYEGHEFDDPGPQYSIRDVMGFLAQSYPELANGSWTKTSYDDDYDLITFYKVTGEKGLDNALRQRAISQARVTHSLDFAVEAEETDFWWRSALSWERFAAMWQEVVEVEEGKAG